MAKSRVSARGEGSHPDHSSLDTIKDVNGSRGVLIEKKIEFLEGFASKRWTVAVIGEAPEISNRRSSRWLNDQLLMELVPPLNAEEIRGLFTPPPWGDSTPLSPFCLTNFREWDRFRNIDMDEQESIIAALDITTAQSKDNFASNKMNTLRAWQRVDHRSRAALRQNFNSKLIEIFEELIYAFVKDSKEEVLELQVQDAFHRLLLHGVCEFYAVVGVTITRSQDVQNGKKASKVMQIKKKPGFLELPPLRLVPFLKAARGEHGGESTPLSRSL